MDEYFYKEYNEQKYKEEYWQLDRSKNKWFSKYVKAKIIQKWILKIKNKGVLLDAGGGVGNWAWCFKNYFKKTIVLDISRRALKKIPEREIIKKQGSVLKIPLKNNSVDCILLIDVFEHIANEDLQIMVKELKRILKKDGRILIFTSQYGYGIGIFWKRVFRSKNRLSKGDVIEGHLNRLKASELKKMFSKNGLEIEDYYNYSIFFQQITDFFKDGLARIASFVSNRKVGRERKGQSIKEETKKIENNFVINNILLFFSLLSYMDLILFGKLIPGTSIFINLKKRL